MSLPDRVKETTTSTGTGNITVLGAVPQFQPLSTSFSTSQSGITLAIVGQSGTEWEISSCTYLGANAFSRDTVQSGSNGTSLVNFSSGVKDVFYTLSASDIAKINAGVVNPLDVGFDIVLCAGQSNMEGNPTADPLIDVADPRTYQFGGSNADAATYRKILGTAEPLHMINGVRTGKTGPATWFAKAYGSTIPTNRKILLVPCAAGSTALVGSVWAVGGTNYNLAITQSNLAITAALALYPNSRFVGAIWAQGEADGLNSITQAQYASGLKAVIAGLRSEITGAANSWFIISAMTPEGIAAQAGEAVINLAHIQVAAETDKCAFVAAVSGMASGVHYTADGVRVMGSRLGLAVKAASVYVGTDVTAPTATSSLVANAAPTVVNITTSEAMSASFIPAASAFAVSGHTVSNVAISGSAINLTVDAFVNGEAARTIAYTQPGANNARDSVGNLLANFSGLAITNNVVGVASAVSMSGPSGGVVSVASTNFSVGVTPIGGAITGTVIVTPSDSGGGGTFTPATLNLTTGSSSGTFTYTPNATPAARTISVTSNGGLANPPNITYTSTSAATAPGAPTIGTATGGNATASVTFTAPASDGGSAITGYTITSSPGGFTNTGVSSPIVVSGLTNATAYTFTATATNAIGISSASAASNSVTPSAGSFSAWNPADKDAGITLSGSNLIVAGTAGFKSVRGDMGKSTGKWYWETKITTGTVGIIGIGRSTAPLNNFAGNTDKSWGYYSTGAQYYGNTIVNTYSSYTTNDVIGIELDMDAKTFRFYKNGVAQGGGAVTLLETSGGSTIAGGVVVYPMGSPNGTTLTANFGASAFAYTPTAGFVALA